MVKRRYVGLRDHLRDNFESSEEHFKASLLETRIKKMGGDLIDLIVVAIRELSGQQVEVIFEQPYPDKTCSRAFLMEVLGEERYMAKKINFVRYYR
jgi:hypothetical protein